MGNETTVGNPACVCIDYIDDATSVPEALERSGATEVLVGHDAILLKPNLVNDTPFPVTTRPEFCAEVVHWLRKITDAEVIIAEGCGSCTMETPEIFRNLGYERMAAELGVELVDLNTVKTVERSIPDCPVFPTMHLPEAAFTHAIISLPVLKAHSLAGITGSLKNMMGFPPPQHYSGSSGSWKKAVFHQRMHQSVRDLCRYVSPTFTLMDASVGLADFHLGGATLSPPAGKLIAGCNALECDRTAATLLGRNWRDIGHLRD
ncbi:DUF362 domain-containing protein [Salidesulfovibrio brasiliensis]|uniref:DUF362 domain-containing protein n=1 Tax=Salidesulfovibrio brasiliensis TaxID=221711 RepID=UPI0006D1EFCB|nr:DUF362 domain-containing protein [Salidesulfovibrio brasiliensis]